MAKARRTTPDLRMAFPNPDPHHVPNRKLKIFATDPMLGQRTGNVVELTIANEPLLPGPVGRKVAVIDYDPSTGNYHEPVDLNHPDILHNHGLEPSEADPKFHQQMVYAVAMKTFENVERSLGRRIRFRGNRPLLILPHAFREANAFYQRDLGYWTHPNDKIEPKTKSNGLLFGHFRASKTNPGQNLPGQTVFTCLSHDIIAHETGHAILDRMNRFCLEATNPDVRAFHEGFSDLVALFQHFTFREQLESAIQSTRTDLSKSAWIVNLANQFGHAQGNRRSLRSAIGDPKKTYRKTKQVHDRGAILVATIFDAFFVIFQRRIQDLLRIATNGLGVLPNGALHPDLVNRIAQEAVKTADSFFGMVVRAVDYLPPVDPTFGDFLRAMVTADAELITDDRFDQLGTLIQAFRSREITIEGVQSLAEDSLVWDHSEVDAFRTRKIQLPLQTIRTVDILQPETDEPEDSAAKQAEREKKSSFYSDLHTFAETYRKELHLDPAFKIWVASWNLSARPVKSGQPVFDLCVQFVQSDDESKLSMGGLPFRGGTTLIVDYPSGKIKQVIAKPIGRSHGQSKEATQRREKQADFAADMRAADSKSNLTGDGAFRPDEILKSLSSIAAIHGGQS